MLTFYGDCREGSFNTIVRPLVDGIVDWRWFNFKTSPDLFELREGEVCLLMGGKALEKAQTAGYYPKNRTITSLRETNVPGPGGGWYLPTNSPMFALSNSNVPSEIAWDVKLAKRLAQNGHTRPEIGEYGWVTGEEFLELVLSWDLKGLEFVQEGMRPLDVALDLETMGFHPWYDDKHIVTLQVSAEPGRGQAVHVLSDLGDPRQKEAFLKGVKLLLTSKGIWIRGANLKFDLVWIRKKWGIECTNFTMDTLIMGSLLNENRPNSLSWHAKTYTDMGGYDAEMEAKYNKGAMELIPKKDLLTYAAGDTDACLQIAGEQRREVAGFPHIAKFYAKLLHPAARAFERIEFRGVHVDLARMAELENSVENERAQSYRDAMRLIPATIKAKFGDNVSLTRPALLRDFLFSKDGLNIKPQISTATGLASTAANHLALFIDHPEAGPFIQAHTRWSKAQKTLRTYVHGFMEHLRPDGRFHPTYFLFQSGMTSDSGVGGGTVTGRLSAKEPAMQVIPKHTPWANMIRRCFTAPPGYVFFEADYSQGELRVVACIANELTMLQAYREGKDLHALTGSTLLNMPFDEFWAMKSAPKDSEEFKLFKRFRQNGKPMNFGLLYGMSAEGYRIYAKDNYGIELTAEEAEGQRETFLHKTYPGLPRYHKQYQAYAARHYEVVSPLGRVRHLPLIHSVSEGATARRQAINSPVQSTLSDMCLWSIALLEQEVGEAAGLEIAGMTHDSIYGYIKEDRVSDVMPKIKHVMENLPFHELGWTPQLTFPIDMEVGTSLGELDEWQEAA